MLSAGVANVVLKFLRSEMPPVQFKLLGTLRMLIDTQGQGVGRGCSGGATSLSPSVQGRHAVLTRPVGSSGSSRAAGHQPEAGGEAGGVVRGQRSRRRDGRVQQAAVGPHPPQQVQGERPSWTLDLIPDLTLYLTLDLTLVQGECPSPNPRPDPGPN